MSLHDFDPLRAELRELGKRAARRDMTEKEWSHYWETGIRPWETTATCCDPVYIRRNEAGERVTTTITLSEYHRTNLLWLLCDVAGYDRPKPLIAGLNTGDWVGEIPNALRVREDPVLPYEEPTLRPNPGAPGYDLKDALADCVRELAHVATWSESETLHEALAKARKALGLP